MAAIREDIPYINIHSHHPGEEGVITIHSHRIGAGESEPLPPFSAGLHPWDAGTAFDEQGIIRYLRYSQIAAVGEIGLDFAVDINREQQLNIFLKQLHIAAERSLPAIIHCVKAFNETEKELRKYTGRLPGIIMHSYIGSDQQTLTAIKHGLYVSLSKVSLQSKRTVDSMASVPLDRLFLETDDEDISIKTIYSEAAEKLSIPMDVLKNGIYNNYKKMFGYK